VAKGKKTAPPPTESSVCECCKKVVNELKYDHDHENGKFRGWICEPCNLGIGRLGDTYEDVKNAFIYMAKVYNKTEILNFFEKDT
jgi:hypothetical protein